MKKFVKFDSAAVALEEAASLKEGKVTELLQSLLEGLKEDIVLPHDILSTGVEFARIA